MTQGDHCYGLDYLYAGPLFTRQLSHVWVAFRGIQDASMRQKGIDYFENRRRTTFVRQRHEIDNSLKHKDCAQRCWGITASECLRLTITRISCVERQFYDYVGRGVPCGPDDDTLLPWAAVASLPFASEIVLNAVDFRARQARLTHHNSYNFKASFNPSHSGETENPYGWQMFHRLLSINQGPIILMVKNYRSVMKWP